MNRLVAIAACACLVFSLAEAPFSHTHSHESAHSREQHGPAFRPHIHLGQHLETHQYHEGTEISASHSKEPGDDDAVFFTSAQDRPKFAPAIFFLGNLRYYQKPPDQKLAWVSVPSTCSHDPPFVDSSSPRSPPA